MKQLVLAFLAFNIYSVALVASFQTNTPFIFDGGVPSDGSLLGGLVEGPGWGDHYVWRLLAAVVATAISGFLAGAVAQASRGLFLSADSLGGKVAAVANIPSVIVWGLSIFLMGSEEAFFDGQTGFLIVSIIAIPLTTWIAFRAGCLGQEQQEYYSQDSPGSILGIGAIHWCWLFVPINFYGAGIIFVLSKFFVIQTVTATDMSPVGVVFNFLSLVPLAVWVGPVVFVKRVLSREAMEGNSPWERAAAVVGAIVGGYPIAVVVQVGSFWLIHRATLWWYGASAML